MINEEELKKIEESLTVWIQEREGTFSWKLIEMLENEIQSLNSAGRHDYMQLKSISAPEYEELMKMRKVFSRKLISAFIFSILLFAIVSALRTLFPALTFLNIINWPLSERIVFSVGVFLVLFLSSMASYYRRWSTFKRQMELSLSNMNYYVSSVAYLQDEKERLESVKIQAISWLKLLSECLHRPWSVSQSWLEDPAEGIDYEYLPLNIRLARAYVKDDAMQMSLNRKIVQRVMCRGWRSKAFDELVSEVSSNLGFDDSGFNIGTLENDLPESPNHHRSMMLNEVRRIRSESFNADSGSSMMTERREATLIVGEKKVGEAAEFIRETIIPALNIPVVALSRDPLDKIEWSLGGGENQNVEHFLTSIFEESSQQVPALSIHIFSLTGQANAVHSEYKSFGFVANGLPIHDPHVQSIPRLGDELKGLELAIRVDLAGPMQNSDIQSLAGGKGISTGHQNEVSFQPDSDFN